MKEDFLEYIWRYRKFLGATLKTTQGDTLAVLDVGVINKNAGPDFFNAKIRINEQLWVGTVELHIKASDWYVHKHHLNKAYTNVVLHVVWESDIEIFDSNNNILPTLELKKITDSKLVHTYKILQSKKTEISCSKQLHLMKPEFLTLYLEKLLVERLEKKAIQIENILEKNNNDWEATLYQLLCVSFGLKVNKEAFETLALVLPYKVLKKEISEVGKLESLLFGQANLLIKKYECSYYKTLLKEYEYLKYKHNLQDSFVKMNFHRMRPLNFPTIRLSQLANLYVKNQQFFNILIKSNSIEAYYKVLKVNTSVYWNTHYTFGKKSKAFKKSISTTLMNHIIINVIIPLKFVYAKKYNLNSSEVIEIYEQLPAEKNTIVNQFKQEKISIKTARESQAIIELKNSYCNKRACLKCQIGNLLLSAK